MLRTPFISLSHAALLTALCGIQLWGQANPKENVIEWNQARIERIQKRVAALKGKKSLTAIDKEILRGFEDQLQKDSSVLRDWRNIEMKSAVPFQASGGALDMPGLVLGGSSGAAMVEKDWRIVFEYFPGTRAQFNELVSLDAREDALFTQIDKPEIFREWSKLSARILSLWDPFKSEMTRKLTILGSPRLIQVTLNGHIHDEDPFPFDEEETADYLLPVKGTLRFGEVLPISYRPAADEVELAINLQCRLTLGPAETVMLEVTGAVDLYESGDKEGSISINERLSHQGSSNGQTARGQDPKDSGSITIRFDLLP